MGFYFRYGFVFEKFLDLVVNCSSVLWSKLLFLLFDRFESQIDVELVTCDVDINPWNVLCGSCERVQVYFQTSYKLDFQRLAQVCADFDSAI